MQRNASQRSVLRHEAAVAFFRHEQRPTGVQSPARKGLEAAPHQTELGEKNTDEPQAALAKSAPKQIRSSQPSRLILNLCQTHRISIEGRPAGHLGRSPEQPGHLPGRGLRSSGMPNEGYANPVYG